MEHAKNMNRNRDDLMALPRPRSSGGSFRSFMASTTDDRRWGSFPCWRRDDEEEEEEEGGVDADPVEAGSGSAQENDQSGRSPSRRDGRSAVRIRPRSGGAATAPTIGRCAVDALEKLITWRSFEGGQRLSRYASHVMARGVLISAQGYTWTKRWHVDHPGGKMRTPLLTYLSFFFNYH